MGWLAVGLSILAIGAAVYFVVRGNRARYERRVRDEMHALVGMPPSAVPHRDARALPAPVARYRDLAVHGREPIHTLRLHHRGTFRTSPSAAPRPIEGRQLFTADPPGFVWTGRVQMAPGIWLDARDMAIGGEGSMRVLLDDTVSLVDVRGPELDQGSALRLLAEMVWYPTALFDERTVTWSAIDDTHARATLRRDPSGTGDVSGIFEFSTDGLPLRMTAARYRDKVGLSAWSGVYRDWRAVSGMWVPFEADVSWELASGSFTYAHWLVDSMEYDEGR